MFFCAMLSGCVTLGDIREEAKTITNEDVSCYTSPIISLLGDSVDNPLQSASIMAIGYIACLVRRLYKKKKGSRA